MARDPARFRERLRNLLARRRLTVGELSALSGVSAATLRRWSRWGAARPKHEHLIAVARALGIDDPWWAFGPSGTASAPAAADRATNPEVDDLRRERPDLFAGLSPRDIEELYSARGVGGSLTPDGVLATLEALHQRRELRRKFEAVLQTHHRQALASVIELMYRDVVLSPVHVPSTRSDRDHA